MALCFSVRMEWRHWASPKRIAFLQHLPRRDLGGEGVRTLARVGGCLVESKSGLDLCQCGLWHGDETFVGRGGGQHLRILFIELVAMKREASCMYNFSVSLFMFGSLLHPQGPTECPGSQACGGMMGSFIMLRFHVQWHL